MNNYQYIILGSGIASYGALEELIKETKNIAIISLEDHCYLRPLISKTTFTTYNINLTYLKDIYQDIDFIKEEVTDIDLENQLINGKYHYENLIYALGAESRKLNIENAYSLRHVDDFYKIKRQLPFIKSAGIVGGGMIGLESAYLLKQMDKNVHVYEYADLLIPRYFNEQDSNYLVDLLANLGIHIHLKARKESYDEDLVLVSIGNQKNNLFNEPIVVDENMQFKENVYACGDCVEGNYALWPEAYQQGIVAGLNALGKTTVYEKKEYPVLCHLGKIGIYASHIDSNLNVSKVIETQMFSVIETIEKTYISIHDGHLIVIGDLRYVDMIKEGGFDLCKD